MARSPRKNFKVSNAFAISLQKGMCLADGVTMQRYRCTPGQAEAPPANKQRERQPKDMRMSEVVHAFACGPRVQSCFRP